MEHQVTEFVEKLKSVAGTNLKAVALYGSAVAGDFHAGHSNVNLLIVLERSDLSALESLHPAMEWWGKQGHAAPLVFTLDELKSSSDIFAIEFTDIASHHRMLFGEDVFTELDIPEKAYRMQIERDLRTNSLRLRQAIVTKPAQQKPELDLMLASVSSFATLFRHALVALGEPRPDSKRDAVRRIAAACNSSAAGFESILDIREGKKKQNEIDAHATLQSYLELVDAVTNAVDRKLAAGTR